MTKIKDLERRIQDANEAYWVKHSPVISDAEYDQLIEDLRSIDPDHPLLTKLYDGTKTLCEHPYPMLSLRKVYNMEDLRSWVIGVSRSMDEKFLIQPKFDGCTCRITDGKLYTRGDGVKGEDISNLSPYIKDIERTDDLGEVVITEQDFKEYFASGKFLRKDGQKFANQRNATAGILGRINDLTNIPKALTFVSYSNCYSVHKTCQEIQELDITTIIAEVLKLGYPLDGLVFKLEDTGYATSLGNTAHHPRGQMAYKFDNCSKESKITDIIWQIGRTGVLTPVLKFNQIDIHGSNIDTVTAHDYKHVKELDIRIGDRILVSRAGDVIPFMELTEHTPDSLLDKPNVPETCPYCGGQLALTVTGVDIVCTNNNCMEKIITGLVYACKTLEMDGWSYATIKALNRSNLYELLKLSLEEIKQVFPGKQGDNLFEIKEHVLKTVPESLILASLGIPLVGKNNSKLILKQVTLLGLACIANTAIQADDPKALFVAMTPMFEPSVMYGSLVNWMTEPKNAIMIKSLLEMMVNQYGRTFSMDTSQSSITEHKTICFTGKMSQSRKAMEDMAKQKGYEPVSSVTRDLTTLVYANGESNSSKLKKAKEYGIQYITESEFLNL